MNTDVLVQAVVAALVLEKLFEAIFGPLWKKFGWEPILKLYAALVVGSGVGMLTGLNAFPVFGMSPLAGQIMTALAIGCGTSFIYDLTDKPAQVVKC